MPTIKQDTSGCQIASVNPYRYRSYYYDAEIAKYYLQSRYYDASVGRFVNSDVPDFCLASLNITGHNLFAYCINNPVNVNDSNGNIALVDDATILVVIGICAILALLLIHIEISRSKRAQNTFLIQKKYDLSWLGEGIVTGIWNWMRMQSLLRMARTANFIAAVHADAEIRSIVKHNSKDRYWTATLKGNYVDIGRAIPYQDAVYEVSNGRNVFTVTRAEAEAVATAAYGNKKPVGPEIDKGKQNTKGYYYHYHIYDRKNKGHVFFLFW